MENFQTLFVFLLILTLLCSCNSGPGDSENFVNDAYSTSEIAFTVTGFPSATPLPSKTPTLTSTPTLTMTPEPSNTPTITATTYHLNTFTSDQLRDTVSLVDYIQDPCEYIKNRWGEGKSTPGTIVVPIMFHSVAKVGREIMDSTTISTGYFEYIMGKAKELGFSTITMDELIGFIEDNDKIPERSMIMILDDRRPGVTELFMPFLEANRWTLTLGWITTDNTTESLWLRMETLAETGYLDVQSHGHDHIYIQDHTPIEEVEEEIYKPIEVIQAHFGTTPSAIIWPGGNFTTQSVSIAHEAGFKLGFTIYPRGPLMFNWIPQGEEELAVGDPLMLLPRYWSTAADVALSQAVDISEDAKQYAEAVKEAELLYFDTYCQP